MIRDSITIQGIRSKAFLPLAIQFFMWLYVVRVNFFRFFNGKEKLPYIKTCNHLSICVNNNIEWEAIGKGVVKRVYSIKGHQYVKEWKVPTENYQEVVNYLDNQVGKGYEFLNFIFHILKVFGFRWLGSWNDKHHSCVELANRALQIAGVEGINKFDNPYEMQRKLNQMFGGEVIKDNYK